jgi:hypothetical protein
MAEAAARVASALAPSFLRRLAGGLGADRVRATVAAALEESAGIRHLLRSASASASLVAAAGGSTPAEAARAAAAAGLCDRVSASVDRWRDAAHAYQDSLIGSETKLLESSKRIQSLAKELRP